MKLEDLMRLLDARLVSPRTEEREVRCGFSCDLLSWVMAKGQPGMAWITVQTHLNVIAVASLHEMACVILPEGITMEEAVLSKAAEEGIAVLQAQGSAFELSGLMYAAGLRAAPEN